MPGGLWLCRVRLPSGLVAVVVPSLCRARLQPHRWMAVRWWKPHSGTRLGRLVGPPRDRRTMWWMSQTLAGWSQRGKAHRGAGGERGPDLVPVNGLGNRGAADEFSLVEGPRRELAVLRE